MNMTKLSKPELTDLINHLVKLSANLRLRVPGGAHSGSVSLDEGTSTDLVPTTGVPGICVENLEPTRELSTDVRPVLLGSDAEGSTDKGVHEGSPEEKSALDKITQLMVIRANIIEYMDMLDGMFEEGEKLLKENTRLGALAVTELLKAHRHAE